MPGALSPTDRSILPRRGRCCAPEDIHDARRVADTLGIPHYAFDRRELFRAEVGQGAYLNDTPMSVSTPGPLDHAVIATGIPHRGGRHHAACLAALERVMHQVAGVRRFGSAALDLAWVAAGRYDGFWETGIHAWDMAAGIAIVREAGGLVSDLSGGEGMMKGGDIVAANSNIHRKIMKILKAAESA